MRVFINAVLAIGLTTGFAATAGAQDQGDPESGKKVYNKCKACHVLDEKKNRVGPHLVGLIGRPAGSVDDYKYSDANKESGVVWDEQTLFEYLENPRQFIKGTKMAFAGLKKEQDRLDIIAYIKQEAGTYEGE